jgi:hypothetical protein
MAIAICPPFEKLGVPQRRKGETVAVGSQQGQIRIRIIPQDPRFDASAVGKGQSGVAGPLHDMAVGQHQAIGRDDHARAHAYRSVRDVGFNPDHRRADAVHYACHRL